MGSRGLLALLLAAFFLSNIGLSAQGRGNRREGKLKEGDAASEIDLKSPDGKSGFKLSEHKGKKPVVLIFGSYT